MAAFNKVNSFVQELGKGTHNFTAHVLKAAFCNTLPVATNAVLADITQIAAGGGYPAGGVTLDAVTWANAGGVSTLAIADEVFTATGAVGPFRYVVLYNSTAAGGPLIGWYDYGSSISLAAGEPFTIDFDGTLGVATLG